MRTQHIPWWRASTASGRQPHCAQSSSLLSSTGTLCVMDEANPDPALIGGGVARFLCVCIGQRKNIERGVVEGGGGRQKSRVPCRVAAVFVGCFLKANVRILALAIFFFFFFVLQTKTGGVVSRWVRGVGGGGRETVKHNGLYPWGWGGWIWRVRFGGGGEGRGGRNGMRECVSVGRREKRKCRGAQCKKSRVATKIYKIQSIFFSHSPSEPISPQRKVIVIAKQEGGEEVWGGGVRSS